MQDQYAADLGDFAKLGLLRALVGNEKLGDGPALRLGVVWYLVPNEAGRGDGKHIAYLSESHPLAKVYEECDPELYAGLRTIAASDDRRVSRLRPLLPEATLEWCDHLDFAGSPGRGPRAVEGRTQSRNRWVDRAIAATAEAEIVFLDPDNGIEPRSRKPWHLRGPKHAYLKELGRFWARGQSVICYHHLGRHATSENQLAIKSGQIREALGCKEVWMPVFRGGTRRAFAVVPHPEHRDRLRLRLRGFVDRLKAQWLLFGDPL